jgi:3-oxoacyl-[acyl-carrier-protein] synthase-3
MEANRMTQLYSQISGWGKYLPEKIITNHDLEKMVDTSHEWIMRRTGIAERRMAAEEETTATMAVAAAQQALDVANLSPADLDLIIVSTSTPDYFVPAVSSTVQAMLQAHCPAFTLVTGCTGFVYSLVTAHQFIASGASKNILVIGVELITRFINWQDRNSCVLFGDGAGAVVVTSSPTPRGVLAFDLGSNGEQGHHIMLKGGGSANPMSYDVIDRGENYVEINGREVFKFATRILPRSLDTILEQSNLAQDDIDHLIPHQANARIIDKAVRTLKFDPQKVVLNVHKYGNTSAASIPIALVETHEEGRLKADDKIAMVSFGAGLTWASAIVQWGTAYAPQPRKNSTNVRKGIPVPPLVK